MPRPSLRSYVVVVAHPDDETLWLTSALPSADVIVAALPNAGPALTERRRSVREAFPLAAFELLDLQSADVYKHMDGLRGQPREHGVSLLESCPSSNAERYRSNFSALLDELAPYFATDSIVYTHNPWGEYGHPEHVQVSNAVVQLAKQRGCSVWAWEGFSPSWQLNHGVRFRADYFPDRLVARAPSAELSVDLELYRKLRALYVQHEAWTWQEDYEPPNPSRFVQLVDDGQVLLSANGRRRSASMRMGLRWAAWRTRRALRDGWSRRSTKDR
jgi:LmbE family N-acetylglucosaminyl deacetylase